MHYLLCLCALVAISFAQEYIRQTGPFFVRNITNGDKIFNSLPVTFDQAASLHVQLYQFWVPEGAAQVNVSFSVLDPNVIYMTFLISTFGFACNQDEYSEGPTYQCANAYSVQDGTKYFWLVWKPGDHRDFFDFGVNRFWYISIGRYYSSNFLDTCGFSLKADIISECGDQEIATPLDWTRPTCIHYTSTGDANPFSQNIVGGNPTGNANYTVYKLEIPQNTANFRIQITSSSFGWSVYGKNYAGAGSAGNNDCQPSPNYKTLGLFSYVYDLYCYTPRHGSYFITLENHDQYWDANITFTMTVCEDKSKGGYKCSFPVYPAATLENKVSLFVPYDYDNTVGSASYAATYFVLDTNGLTSDFVLSYTSTRSDVDLMVRRDGYPTYDSSVYEGSSIGFNQFDWQVPGLIYIGLICRDPNGCPVEISTSGSLIPATTGQITTGSSEGEDENNEASDDDADGKVGGGLAGIAIGALVTGLIIFCLGIACLVISRSRRRRNYKKIPEVIPFSELRDASDG